MCSEKSIKIMLVDRDTNTEFHNDFKTVIEQDGFFKIVKITNGAKEALDFYAAYAPDIIITDLIYAQGDGLSTIFKIREIEKKRSKKVYIIVVTHVLSEIVLKKLTIDGLADYLFSKNMPDFSSAILLEHLNMMKDHLNSGVRVMQQKDKVNLPDELKSEEQDLIMREFIENNIMNRLCIKPSLRGRNFLIDALVQGSKYKSNEPIMVYNDVYPIVASIHKTTVNNIDNCIKNALQKAWTTTELEILKEIYPINLPYDHPVPTSKDFIDYHLRKLKQKFR